MTDLLAHRGYAARYPENTLAALDAAVEAGIERVEFDVQLSADRVPVLLHDADLARTCGVEGPVWERSASELARIRAGEVARLGDTFAEEPLPTLAAAIGYLAGRSGVHAFVELKGESIARFGVEGMLDAVLPVLAPLTGRVVVISFEEQALAGTRARAGLPIGWCVARYDAPSRARAEALAPEYLLTDQTGLPPEGALWPGSWRWVLYEVTDPVLAARLQARGADIIETMDPGAFTDPAPETRESPCET